MTRNELNARQKAQTELLASASNLSEVEATPASPPPLNSSGPEFNRALISFLRRCFGVELGQPVRDAETINDLLLSNNIFYRHVSLYKDMPSWQSNPILVNSSNSNGTYILESKRNEFCLTDASDYSTTRLKTLEDVRQLTEDYGYELYPLIPESSSSLKSLFDFVLPVILPDFYRSVALSIVLIIFSLVSPLITAQVIGDVVPSGDLQWVASTFVIGVVLALYQSGFTYLKAFYTSRIEVLLNLRLDAALYRRILSLPVTFIDQYSTGDLGSRIDSVSSIIKTISGQCLTTILGSLSLIGYAGMMLYLDTGLSAPLFLYVFISSIIQVMLVRRQVKLYKKSIPLKAENYDLTIETLSAVAQIRVSGNEPFFLQRWYMSLMNVLRLDMEAARMSDWNTAISSILNTLGTVIIYVVLIKRLLGANDLSEATVGITIFVVFTNAYSGFSNSLLTLVGVVNSVTGTLLVEIERALPLLKEKSEASASFGSERIALNGLVEFKNVSFAYPKSIGTPLFSDLSFALKPGKFNVIFGPSGSGKSTVLSMILGFALPHSGNILIDGTPLSSLDIRHYRSQIGAVLQSSDLTPGPIKDAITGGLDISEERIWNTLNLVNIDQEIDEMPMKLQTILSEGSTVVSGGQRQRLCIARALIHEPRMLLEDEATSALDTYSQSVIIRNLRDRSITRIVVAHRIATVRDCDHMVVINGGQVEASGSFSECLSSSPFLREAAGSL